MELTTKEQKVALCKERYNLLLEKNQIKRKKVKRQKNNWNFITRPL